MPLQATKDTYYNTKDNHIELFCSSNNLYMTVFCHIRSVFKFWERQWIPLPRIKSHLLYDQRQCFIKLFCSPKHLIYQHHFFFYDGQFKDCIWPKMVIYWKCHYVLWIWKIRFNKILLAHIFKLCLWIVWTGNRNAVAT